MMIQLVFPHKIFFHVSHFGRLKIKNDTKLCVTRCSFLGEKNALKYVCSRSFLPRLMGELPLDSITGLEGA